MFQHFQAFSVFYDFNRNVCDIQIQVHRARTTCFDPSGEQIYKEIGIFIMGLYPHLFLEPLQS